jgi:signal peptidase I
MSIPRKIKKHHFEILQNHPDLTKADKEYLKKCYNFQEDSTNYELQPGLDVSELRTKLLPIFDTSGFRTKSVAREYIEAIIIAVILALVIRTLGVQAFKIPSGSMIPTLLIGDHILVNKFIYGFNIPGTKTYDINQATLWQLERSGFDQNRLKSLDPLLNKPFRSESAIAAALTNLPLSNEEKDTIVHYAHISYKRIFQLTKPKNGDVVVFKFPEDESKDFIKRVIGIPGDKIDLKSNLLYLSPKDMQTKYGITYQREKDGILLNDQKFGFDFHDEVSINNRKFIIEKDGRVSDGTSVDTLYINDQPVSLVGKGKTPCDGSRGEPNLNEMFSCDRYAETIGKRTHTVMYSTDPYHFRPTRKGILPITVPADHLFVMGDNRDNSHDSRAWGFVPMKNLLGKALIIYFSIGPSGGRVSQLTRIGSLIR